MHSAECISLFNTSYICEILFTLICKCIILNWRSLHIGLDALYFFFNQYWHCPKAVIDFQLKQNRTIFIWLH